jgi:glyoxylase-like metal-dependent hydrolase (beta-lactamase superfamily II)
MLKSNMGSQVYNKTLGLKTSADTTLKVQVEKLDLNLEEVSDVILTHLHPDHTAGLVEFPDAHVHLSKAEWDYVNQLPQHSYYKKHFDKTHWEHTEKFIFHQKFEMNWFGFKAEKLEFLSREAYLVLLLGHTGGGHCGVAIKFQERWVFHVGDAYFLRDDLNENLKDRHILSEMVQASISPNSILRLKTAKQIADLKKQLKDKLILISAHEEKDSDQLFNE